MTLLVVNGGRVCSEGYTYSQSWDESTLCVNGLEFIVGQTSTFMGTSPSRNAMITPAFQRKASTLISTHTPQAREFFHPLARHDISVC